MLEQEHENFLAAVTKREMLGPPMQCAAVKKSDREHVLIIHICTDPLQGLIADTGYY